MNNDSIVAVISFFLYNKSIRGGIETVIFLCRDTRWGPLGEIRPHLL
jgi:hypothetical protein